MTDKWFPRSIKPLTNKTYAMSRGANIKQTPVQGGIARQSLRSRREAVPFQLSFSLDCVGYKALLQFYDIVINHGSDTFKMMLDSGTGVAEHICYIQNNTFKSSLVSGDNWHVTFTAIATTTPSQG